MTRLSQLTTQQLREEIFRLLAVLKKANAEIRELSAFKHKHDRASITAMNDVALC